MKRFAINGLVVGVVTVLAGTIAFAGTGAKDGLSGPDEKRTLRFDVVFSPFNFLDLGEEAPRSETKPYSMTS